MEFELQVQASASLVAEAAADRFVSSAGDAVRTRGEFIVALSGGSTPRSMYALLAAEPRRSRVDWSRVQILWGDERCVPPDHAASNYRMACEALLSHVPVPEANVHRIRGEDKPEAAAAEYERVIRRVLHTPVGPPHGTPEARIDLVLLGLGPEGHTASIFPGSTEVQASAKWVRATYVHAVSMWRITVMPALINAAAEVAFLVSGGEKADILRQVLEGPQQPSLLPAQLIAPQGSLLWLVDAAAAAELGSATGR
jgi:6-phosphogluconolactonase